MATTIYMNPWNYKRFSDERRLILCLSISLLLVAEYDLRPERFPLNKLTDKVGSEIGKWIDRIENPEKSEDKLVQGNSGSYNLSGGFDDQYQK
jgi:hypothetical protein